mgnify:CR=1 FL=1
MICSTITWSGLGARDFYRTLRSSLHLAVVGLALLLFRPLLSAYTHRVAAVLQRVLMMRALYSTDSLLALARQEALSTMQALGTVALELSALPLWMTWQWHYHGHWLVDYIALLTLLAHWIALLLALIALQLGTDSQHRPAFFDTLLRWWDRQSATSRNNSSSKKLRIKKKNSA